MVVSVAPFGADGSDTFPDASVAFAVTSPTGMLFATVMVATPSSPAVPVPISWLSLSYNFTVDPGSAFTLTVTGLFVFALPVKSLVISGAFGLVVSVAPFGALNSELTPSGLTALAVTLPTGIFSDTVILAVPLLPAVAEPISLPVTSYNLTVVPASDLTSTSTGVFVLALPSNEVLISGTDGFLITFPFNLISGVGSLAPTPEPLCL